MVQLFFNQHGQVCFYFTMPVLALIDLVLIIGLSVWTLIEFYKINKISRYITCSYVAWLLVACTQFIYSRV